jgi:hypothetical protein
MPVTTIATATCRIGSFSVKARTDTRPEGGSTPTASTDKKLSPSECQPRHLHTDNTVIQTSPSNNIPSTYPIVAAAIDCSSQQIAEAEKRRLINKARTPIGAPDPFSPYLNSRSSRQAADSAAERSWHNALIDRFGTEPIYAVIVEEMDAALQEAATKAELKRRGAGIISILEELVRRGIRLT